MRRSLVIATIVMLASTAMPTYAACWQEAGERYHIDPLLLYAIARVESNLNPRARNVNPDGSYDIGLMQINSRHLPRLAAYGITEARLLGETCTSIMTGAWILGEFVQRMGYGWQAIGAYNAGGAPSRESLRMRYALKVWRYYGDLCRQRDEHFASRSLAAASGVR